MPIIHRSGDTWPTWVYEAPEVRSVYALPDEHGKRIWFAGIQQGTTITSKQIIGNFATDADAWIAARKQFTEASKK